MYRSSASDPKAKGSDNEALLRQRIEKEVKEKFEQERKEKGDNKVKDAVKTVNKKDEEQVFYKAQDPDLVKILKALQDQVAELAAAEKARKTQEQMYYQNWFQTPYQNPQLQ